MQSVLVIGGSGFIGGRIARLMTARGARVASMDVAPAPAGPEAVTSFKGDVTQFDELMAAMTAFQPTRVINLSYALGSSHPPHAAVKLNILGMDNCFEAARLCGVERVVFGSSIAVNGLQAHYGERPITEEDVPFCETQYGVHKIFNEWQARDYREKHDLSIVGVRAAMVTGHDKTRGSLDHVQCITKPAVGEPVRLPFRDAPRCLIHVDDAAEAFARITLADRLEHKIYNTGGATVTLGELATLVRRHVPDADITFERETGGREGAMNYLSDNRRIRTELAIAYPPLSERVRQMIEDTRRTHANAGPAR